MLKRRSKEPGKAWTRNEKEGRWYHSTKPFVTDEEISVVCEGRTWPNKETYEMIRDEFTC